jgi:hypothetical protein
LGDGPRQLALGGPPRGGPRGRPVILDQLSLIKQRKKALEGSWGGPWGGPGGVSVGPRGASGGVRGPLPGGYPPGGPLVTALPTDNTALLEPPPRGAPRGAIFGGSGLAGGKIKLSPV